MDTNGDGLLSTQELIEAYSQLMTREEAVLVAERVVWRVYLDCDGCINYSEFMLAAQNIHLLLTTRNLKAIFTQLDRNESGKIAFDGFKEELRKHGLEVEDGSGFGPVRRAELSRLCEIDAGRGGYEGENRPHSYKLTGPTKLPKISLKMISFPALS